MKSFKKKSPQAKAGIIAFIVVMAVLISYVLYSNLKPEDPVEYDVAEAQYGTITDYLDVSGTVESGVTEDLSAIEGVVAEEVFVSVGDTVKKGDKLATFNVSGAASCVEEARKAYEKALDEYNETVSTSQTNSERKAEIAAEVERVNGEITVKQSEIDALNKELEGVTTETAPIPDEQINQIAMQMVANGSSLMQVKAFKEAAKTVELPVTDSESSEKQQELITKNLELAQLNAELSALYAEDATTVVTDDTVTKALKSVADSKKADYDKIKAAYDKMSAGWIAENDGIVTQVNIKAGERFVPVADTSASSSIDIASLLGGSVDDETMSLISSLMGSSSSSSSMGTGIRFESYEDMLVTVTVGKSDLLKIKVGMEAVITSLDSEYEGEVVYVSATASESSSGLDISSIASSLMGSGSGGQGAVVKIKINNPDEKIVIGFDVDIKVVLDVYDDVLKVPVESVMYNSGTYSVFVVDEDDIVTKRTITRGSLDDTSYEVVDGLVEGEAVVRSPDPNMEDGTKIARKNG